MSFVMVVYGLLVKICKQDYMQRGENKSDLIISTLKPLLEYIQLGLKGKKERKKKNPCAIKRNRWTEIIENIKDWKQKRCVQSMFGFLCGGTLFSFCLQNYLSFYVGYQCSIVAPNLFEEEMAT